MAFEKLTDSISELKDNIRALKYSSLEYYKLDLYKKFAKGTISLINVLLLSFLGFFALLFISIAVAISLSDALDSPGAGFYIVGGFYILLIILVITVGKDYIKKKILLTTSRKFFND